MLELECPRSRSDDEDERGIRREARVREVSEGRREKLVHTMIVTGKQERKREKT